WSANENDRVKIKQPFLKNTARKTVISVGKRSSSFIRSDIQVTIQLIGNPSCIVSYLVFTLISLAREYNVIILGLDHAGKTTVLEKVKTIFTPSQPGLNPSQITPTIGQNLG
ncbi:hypothetical protein PSTG_06658, partial [Puccinia striiformis f. sp. tritici PST-78]